ncbi:MAG: AGE family epimerase/isomerase [Bacteroidales bacterium]
MKDIDLISWQTQLQTELKNILHFWQNDAINPEDNQFYGEISGNGIPITNSSKGIIMYSRIMWSFSAAAQFYSNPDYIHTADIAKSFIESSFFDANYGGFFWEVDHIGKPLVKKKQVYAQAFIIYAYTEYFLATHDFHILEKAMTVFHLLENNCRDTKNGGYFEAFSETWDKLHDVRLSDKDLNEPKGMNTNLHVLEAYTRLYKATKDPQVLSALEDLIEIFCTKIIDSNNHVTIFFSENWEAKTHEYSYGHDIESSWLIWEAIIATQNKQLQIQYKPLVIEMAETFLAEGLDASQSAVLYEKNTFTQKIDSDRHWWVQAEAMEGLTHAYVLTKNTLYLKTAYNIWQYIHNHIIDKKNGEWFWRVSSTNIPYNEEQKAGQWKGPYHNSRALINMISHIQNFI